MNREQIGDAVSTGCVFGVVGVLIAPSAYIHGGAISSFVLGVLYIAVLEHIKPSH